MRESKRGWGWIFWPSWSAYWMLSPDNLIVIQSYSEIRGRLLWPGYGCLPHISHPLDLARADLTRQDFVHHRLTRPVCPTPPHFLLQQTSSVPFASDLFLRSEEH